MNQNNQHTPSDNLFDEGVGAEDLVWLDHTIHFCFSKAEESIL
jgi:hypothetical protein